jgi:hypothetical protein
MEPGMSTVNYQEERGDFDEPENPSIENLAEQQLAEMDEKKAKQLTTPLRQNWSRAQVVAMKIDKIVGMETDLVATDKELQKLALQKKIIEGRISDRIDEILKNRRVIPYQISEKGVRIDLSMYDIPAIRDCCEKQGFEFDEDFYNNFGYIRPIGGQRVENAVHLIRPILEKNFLLQEA